MSNSPVLALAEKLAAEIEAGGLAPGTLMPTHRDLAAKHGLALASASKVYALLKERGLVIGETGRGTFVRDRLMGGAWDSGDEARQHANTTDLSFNHPVLPGQTELLRATLRELAASGDLAALMHQQPTGGRGYDRKAVRDFLARARAIDASDDRVFIVNGTQHGLDMAVRALLKPGDEVAVDALTYPGFKLIAQARYITLVPVGAGNSGPDMEALDGLCRSRKIRAIYTMPTLHNPLGWVLTQEQRETLVAIARRHDCFLIEDAAYAYLDPGAPPALVTMAPERTVYVSSLSKSVATGLRFGYMVVPPACAASLKAQLRANLWSLSSLVTTIGTKWMRDGTAARLEQEHRQHARQRQAVAREVFSGMAMRANPTSLFIWLPLPDGLRQDRIAAVLAQRNIAVSKAEAYATTRHAPHALRLGLSSVPQGELKNVLQRVRESIEMFPI